MNEKEKKIVSYLNLGLDFVETEKLVGINRYDIESFVTEKLEVKDGVYSLAEIDEVKQKTEIEQCIENIGGSKQDYDIVLEIVKDAAMKLFKQFNQISKKTTVKQDKYVETKFIKYKPFLPKNKIGYAQVRKSDEILKLKNSGYTNKKISKIIEGTESSVECFINNYTDYNGVYKKNSYFKGLRVGEFNDSGRCLINHEDYILKMLNNRKTHRDIEFSFAGRVPKSTVSFYVKNFTKKVNGVYVRNND
jgi:hypothetical protein